MCKPNNKLVIVSQSELDAIEQARIELYEMFDAGDTHTLIKLSSITQPMWLIANKKRKVIDKQ